LTSIDLKPDFQSLITIKACQAAHNTSFCWPPNGTRVCIPQYSIPFYWPTDFYGSDNRVAVDTDTTSRYTLWVNNTGNRTQSFSQYTFESTAERIPDTFNEKSIKMYMRERLQDAKPGSASQTAYDGPTLTLVKTADFTTASARATSTRRPSSNDNDDDRLVRGAVAGIVVGVIVAIVALCASCCYCCGCCGKGSRKARANVNKEEHARIMAQATELMQQGGARNQTGADTQLSAPTRAEEGRAETFEEPPPKYTP
jgi:hypothetical protein